MKKLLFVGLLHLIFTLFLSIDASAQAKARVKFAKGASSASVKGKITGYKYVDYALSASAGQTMSVKLNADNTFLQFVIFDGNMENLEGATGVEDWSGELPQNGNYTIRVLFPRAEARRKSAFANYTIKISIR